MRTILVTGGAGFIGARLVRQLVAGGHTVALITRANTDLSRIRDLLPRVRHVTGDLADRAAVRELVRVMRPAGVFHLAASVVMSGQLAPTHEVINTNFLGTVNLLDAAAEAGCGFFVQAGSSFEYGIVTHPLAEDDHCRPVELYGVTKLAATRYGQALALVKELPVLTLRLFTPYGPGIQQGRLVERVVSAALAGAPLALTDPRVTRDFIFVDDVVAAFVEAARLAPSHRGEVFNVGSGTAATLAQLVALVQSQTGSQSEVRWHTAASPPYDRGYWCADMRKTFAAFSWRPRTDLAAGMAEFISWCRREPTQSATSAPPRQL